MQRHLMIGVLAVVSISSACSGGPGESSGGSSGSTSSSGGNTGSIAAKDFDQSCQAATDCVAVLEGAACTCACANAAIAKTAQSAYQARQTTINMNCPKIGCAPPCKAPDLACEANKCVLH